MQKTIENQTCSILNNNESEIETIKNNIKIIPMKRAATDYVASFNSFAIKTAKSTLEMCRVVYEAKSELEAKDFEKFCEAIARSHEDSTIRKYLAIGARYNEFIAYADRMPNSWTSIYLITTIPADKLLTMINDAKSLKILLLNKSRN